jgi:patatin-like phospholipase/acyl hydrolase
MEDRSLQPAAPQPNDRAPDRFRILSLEGGGIMGAFSASVLATLEEQTGRRCADHFDLIAGTSTGGIIAIGLALGLPARTICDFYVNQGADIFPNTGFASRTVAAFRHLFRPKHSQDALRKTLQSILRKPDGAEFRLSDARVRLVIPTYDGLSGRIYILKTQHHPRFVQDVGASAVDVALATSAAPTYFSAAKFPLHNASYVDGGVWANCPALVAVTEAIHFLNIDRTQIDLLNVGTTTEPFNTLSKVGSGVLGWNKGLISLFMNAQAEASRAMAKLLVEQNFHQINYTAPAGTFSLDDASRVADLAGLGRAEAVKRENLEAVQRRFLNGRHAAPYVAAARA